MEEWRTVQRHLGLPGDNGRSLPMVSRLFLYSFPSPLEETQTRSWTAWSPEARLLLEMSLGEVSQMPFLRISNTGQRDKWSGSRAAGKGWGDTSCCCHAAQQSRPKGQLLPFLIIFSGWLSHPTYSLEILEDVQMHISPPFISSAVGPSTSGPQTEQTSSVLYTSCSVIFNYWKDNWAGQ